MTETPENTEKINKHEIDMIDTVRILWVGRKTIYKTIAIFFILGIIIVILSPREYKSKITLVVEPSSSKSQTSSILQQFGLGGLLGGGESDALAPTLYPEVIQTTPFLLELMQQKVTESKYDSTITLEHYLKYHTHPSFAGVVIRYTVGLPGKIMKWIREEKDTSSSFQLRVSSSDSTFLPIKISKEQSELIKGLGARITTEQDFKKSYIFEISVEMQDPLVVAQVTSCVVKRLTRYIIEYRTKKAKTDLKFVAIQTAEAKDKYIEAQQALADFKDRNKNVILATVSTEQDRLTADFNLAFDVYSTLAKQLEQSKIKVQEETPVFNEVNPAQIPLKKSSPNTVIVLIAMIFLGVLIGAGIILGKMYFKKIKNILTEN